MARVFLDANVLIDLVEGRKNVSWSQFAKHNLFITPLSIHILTYLYKYKIPNKKLADSYEYLLLVSLTDDIAKMATTGPTSDFEDNIQLHSSAEAECDLFLTSDKKLLKMKYFGKVKIVERI